MLFQLPVKLFSFFAVRQALIAEFTGIGIHQCNLLEARMIITASFENPSTGTDSHPRDESVACGGTNEGLRRKKALWRPAGRVELQSLVLAPWASRRRQDLLDVLDQLTPKIEQLSQALEEEVERGVR